MVITSRQYCLAFQQGIQLRVYLVCGASALYADRVSAINIQSGSAPIRIVRIVRVDVARRIRIPDVVRIGTISRASETVLRITAYSP